MTQKTTSNLRRDEIIDIASRLFYEQGYHRTGIQQIIEEVGVAKGTFYTHFKSKETLGVAWLKKHHIHFNSILEEAIKDIQLPDEKILGIFDFLGHSMEKKDFRGCAFLNTLAETPEGDNPLRKEIVAYKKSLSDRFQSLVQESFPDWEINECKNISWTIFLLYEGSLVSMQNFQELWPVEAAKKQIRTLLNK